MLVIAMQVIHNKLLLILNCIHKHLTVISNTLTFLKLSEQISLSLIMILKTMNIHFRKTAISLQIFKGCLPQILLGLLLNTLSQMNISSILNHQLIITANNHINVLNFKSKKVRNSVTD